MRSFNAISCSAALAAIVLTTGCATHSRLGGLIPAHYQSNQRKGEKVWLHVAEGANAPNMIAAPARVGPAVAVPGMETIAAAAVGLAVDYVKGQMEKEAESYNAQFGQKVWLSTAQLTKQKRMNVLLTRWVDGSVPNTQEYRDASNAVRTIVTSAVAGSTPTMNAQKFEENTKGKTLAFAYCIEIDRSAAPDASKAPPFLMRPLWKWQRLSKAKVVSWRSANPVSWLSGLLFKTGNSVEYDVYVTIDALLLGKDGVPKMTTVGVGDPIQGPEKYDLSGKSNWEMYDYGNRTVGWVAIPGYPGMNDQGYLSLHTVVNESDPSNVKKTLLKGAEQLEKNKKKIVDSIVGGQN